MWQRRDRDRFLSFESIYVGGQCALQTCLVTIFTRPESVGLSWLRIPFKPSKSLGTEGDDERAFPVHRQKLGDERSEPLFDRFGVGLVAGRLVRDGIGQDCFLERGFDATVRLVRRLPEPSLVESRADEPATGADERLAHGNLILPQVAAEDANGRFQGPREEDRPERVFLRLLVDGPVDREIVAAGLLKDGLFEPGKISHVDVLLLIRSSPIRPKQRDSRDRLSRFARVVPTSSIGIRVVDKTRAGIPKGADALTAVVKILEEAESVLRESALRYPEAFEDFPWGERVIKVRKKIFVFLNRIDVGLKVCIKLPESNADALALPYVTPAGYGMGKHGWVVAAFGPSDEVPLEMLLRWIDESYRAIAPKKLVATLGSWPRPVA
jgi:predicted DNA-binding protein (MmcQ/YjbR family)